MYIKEEILVVVVPQPQTKNNAYEAQSHMFLKEQPTSVYLQTNDLNAVHVGCKFSCRFTLNEVEDRWFALLYDPVALRLASYGMKQLPCDIVQQIQSNTLWSKEEEDLLAKTSATTTANVQYFQKLLEDNTATFHQYRTAKSVMQHWLQMKHYQLLDDQTVLALGSATATFSDFEEQGKEMTDEVLEHELNISDRRAKRETRQLEEEIPRWQAIVDSLNESGTAPTEFDSQTLAVLRGRLVRYLMRSREIIVSRSTKDHNVDVNLSLEGPAGKVSRKQAVIRLKTDGEYYIMNEGRRPIFIDGKPVLTDIKAKLHHNSTFEVTLLVYEVNGLNTGILLHVCGCRLSREVIRSPTSFKTSCW
ncbi:microspherule protein 1-like [Xenia sp. Carnegie-2017]|uniref:microspherule protein 1-like n=1 Tax=Xenia sp. Carnegie-2017 TaxID=2897299 RepID=UPI001F04AD4A|nr:microspherule protein 1-like [Xenia sp. Carnegie-2017]